MVKKKACIYCGTEQELSESDINKTEIEKNVTINRGIYFSENHAPIRLNPNSSNKKAVLLF